MLHMAGIPIEMTEHGVWRNLGDLAILPEAQMSRLAIGQRQYEALKD